MRRRTACRDVELSDGSVVRVRGDRAPSPEDLAALEEIVDAARAREAARPLEEREAQARRQAEALDRLHRRTR